MLGCKELMSYFKKDNITYLTGNAPQGAYYKMENGKWDQTSIEYLENKGYKEISVEKMLRWSK